ncbi:ADP-ribosylglycohydrolase family protein [Azotobacter beijerinckii]|uniref:ADP-ribosylglycohydrolase n=1 Tax=Azotobacter beijerinckii TaxID=170623 RepID=A0A1I4DH92_9GAMM|nr:ADP-ribosylglycohydrolase family protein [Azotobacter beijerinckii]SFB34655.1 ADP-ribosylglycohydrolase [Azotobacter beijerinckii]SFK91847.1 ADP-ribosylglycohydrolase [Azotobacter beijerinckii]
MLELERIQPWMLLRDSRCNTLLRILRVAPPLAGGIVVDGHDQLGNHAEIALSRSDETYLQAVGHAPRLRRDPAAVLGCLLGGAAGDALGAPVEFLRWPEIERQFGARGGIVDFVPAYGRLGAITDDTQMMLFTAEGLLRAWVCGVSHGVCHPPSIIHHALLRWLLSQGEPAATAVGRDGWLFGERRLWSRRAPGNTCLSALRTSRRLGEPAGNASKGCGGVMRVAPCAFFPEAFDKAAESARLTHGHPTGYLAAGLFADILARLWSDENASLLDAIRASLAEHGGRPGMEETRRLVERVLAVHAEGVKPTPQGIEQLGGGWVAEEALAIGLWCALSAGSLEEGLIRAVNHSGDSDSTGLIAGHFLGLLHGPEAIPARWRDGLELRDVIERIALDICLVPGSYRADGSEASGAIGERYPGW